MRLLAISALVLLGAAFLALFIFLVNEATRRPDDD
jgi:hypothetical protein